MAASTKANEVKVPAISAEVLEQAKKVNAFGVELAKADAAYEMVIPTVAANVARILGTSPSFDLWNEVSREFRAGYINQKKCESKTADNRWFAITSYMEGNMELKKPSAPTVAADKKAKERAALDKKVKAAKAKFVKPADAFQEAEVLTKAGKVAEAKVVMAAAHELQKQVIEDVKKQNKERVSKVKEQLKAALAKCEDVEAMMAALEILKYGKDAVKSANDAKTKAPRKVSGKQDAKV